MLDLCQLLSSPDVNWWTVMFLSDSHSDGTHSLRSIQLLRHWCRDTFLQTWWRNKLILFLVVLSLSTSSAHSHYWVNCLLKTHLCRPQEVCRCTSGTGRLTCRPEISNTWTRRGRWRFSCADTSPQSDPTHAARHRSPSAGRSHSPLTENRSGGAAFSRGFQIRTIMSAFDTSLYTNSNSISIT